MGTDNTSCIVNSQYNLYRAYLRHSDTLTGVMQKINETAKRLKDARVKAGFDSAAEFASHYGLEEVTYRSHENGHRNLTLPAARKYAQFLNVSPHWLLEGDNISRMVPVLGCVGAGAKVYSFEQYPEGIEDPVPGPQGISIDGIAALRVRGDSQKPRLEDGDLIFYRKVSDGITPECLGKLCVVELENDGMLVKKITEGTRKGLYHLYSHNDEPLFDQKLKWASRVIDIRPL